MSTFFFHYASWTLKHLLCCLMPLSFFETRQLITCENGKEDKQFNNCNYWRKKNQDSQLAFATMGQKERERIKKKPASKVRMINGCCFLVSNVSHYNPIQHHLSCAWSISSMPLSITMQHTFSICSANCTTSDFCISITRGIDCIILTTYERYAIMMHLSTLFRSIC